MSATASRAEGRRTYADASALVKLVVREAESADLVAYLGDPAPKLVTSRLAIVEVTRAARIARPAAVEDELERVLGACDLLAVTNGILQHAAELASERLRALDAIHLASIAYVRPTQVLAYDPRLAGAARELGFEVAHPGAGE